MECNIWSLAPNEICSGDRKNALWKFNERNQLREFPTISIYYNKVWCTFYHLSTFYHDNVLWNCVHVIKGRKTLTPGKLLRIHICIWYALSCDFHWIYKTICIPSLEIGLKSISKTKQTIMNSLARSLVWFTLLVVLRRSWLPSIQWYSENSHMNSICALSL